MFGKVAACGLKHTLGGGRLRAPLVRGNAAVRLGGCRGRRAFEKQLLLLEALELLVIEAAGAALVRRKVHPI